MKTHEWSSNMQSKVLGLIDGQRHSLADITKVTNIPKSTVYDIKKRSTAVSKQRSGCPLTLTAREKRHLEIYLRTNKSTRRSNLTQLKKVLNLDVHETTIRRALNDLGYNHRIARHCPFLNKRDRERRLQFAKEHAHWTVEDWGRVLFNDEMGVKLFMERNTRDYIWRKEGEEFHPDCINYKKHPQGTGLMFWGVFRKGKIGPCVFFNLEKGQKVNSVLYRDQVLLGPLKYFWEESFLDVHEPIVMEDNAPVHKGVYVATRKQLGMVALAHPPNSPDLNPIEHVWAYIKDIIAKDYSEVSSEKEMKKIVRKLWEEFPSDKWDHLIESMPDRMQRVIKARGGWIET